MYNPDANCRVSHNRVRQRPDGDTIKGKGVKIHSKSVRDEGQNKFVAMTQRKKNGSLCSKTQCTVHEP